GVGDPHADDRRSNRRQWREEQENPEEREADQQAWYGTRHEHEIVYDARPAVVAPMRRETDRRVTGDGDRAADRPDQDRVPDRPHVRGLVEDRAEVVEREGFGEAYAEAPVGHERTKRNPRDRHDHAHEQPESQQRNRDPLPFSERQFANAARLTLDRRVLARVLEESPLQQDERNRHCDDADRDRGHQVIRRRAELIRELIEIRRQHQMTFRVAQYQRQSEQLDAEEKDEHGREQQRGHDQRQADRRGDAKR